MKEQNRKVTIGEKAPDFLLPTNENTKWRLSDHLGEVVALLFYPQNETLVCTKQLCSVRDNWQQYLKTRATVVAVSPGTVEEHQSFIKNHNLPMTILADADKAVTNQFCSHWIFPTFLTRSIIIVDARGFVRTKDVMLRAFRPPDRAVITSIYDATADLLIDDYRKITKQTKERSNNAVDN